MKTRIKTGIHFCLSTTLAVVLWTLLSSTLPRPAHDAQLGQHSLAHVLEQLESLVSRRSTVTADREASSSCPQCEVVQLTHRF